jgi:hypothetical protein
MGWQASVFVLLYQYLYFCTSKASKLSAWIVARSQGGLLGLGACGKETCVYIYTYIYKGLMRRINELTLLSRQFYWKKNRNVMGAVCGAAQKRGVQYVKIDINTPTKRALEVLQKAPQHHERGLKAIYA